MKELYEYYKTVLFGIMYLIYEQKSRRSNGTCKDRSRLLDRRCSGRISQSSEYQIRKAAAASTVYNY
ncbi:hypothetical protein L5515_005128 [Caenorhabditis briggsae]|uniref:Uncharacterized protein n=1 Tax=Caenorhabditis briggsae TaxID=6238 RepID=A0AAE9JEH9_CAEBR|nr:hypothetical protein L5515_005128 [Caenorhabditis briggsae]